MMKSLKPFHHREHGGHRENFLIISVVSVRSVVKKQGQHAS